MRRTITTDQMERLIAAGVTVRLPSVSLDEQTAQVLGAQPGVRESATVTSVEFDGIEEVQCISIDDDDHLYLTDDLIPTHNTNNLIFLKSNDDTMNETLSKMSGVRHVTRRDSKTVTEDMSKIVKGTSVDSKVSYTMSTSEEPLIKQGDLAYLNERNSIVFRAGDMPIWNRNETILPMSWRLFSNTIIMPGEDFSLQTIPTLSTAAEFDVRKNQPDFEQLLEKRIQQALLVEQSEMYYKEAFGYSDIEITRLDPDVYSDDIMEIIDSQISERAAEESDETGIDFSDPSNHGAYISSSTNIKDSAIDNIEALQEISKAEHAQEEFDKKIYAGGQIARGDLVDNISGMAKPSGLDNVFLLAFLQVRNEIHRDHDHFYVSPTENICSAEDHDVIFIRKVDNKEDMKKLGASSEDEESRVYSEEPSAQKEFAYVSGWELMPAFKTYLAGLDSWADLAEGRFDMEVARQMRNYDDATSLV